MTTGDMVWGGYAKIMHAASLTPVPQKRWRTFTLWLRRFTQVIWLLMLQKYRDQVARRDPRWLGSWLQLVITADCFWAKRNKKNHCGDSLYGANPIMDFFGGGILASHIGCLSKLCGDLVEVSADHIPKDAGAPITSSITDTITVTPPTPSRRIVSSDSNVLVGEPTTPPAPIRRLSLTAVEVTPQPHAPDEGGGMILPLPEVAECSQPSRSPAATSPSAFVVALTPCGDSDRREHDVEPSVEAGDNNDTGMPQDDDPDIGLDADSQCDDADQCEYDAEPSVEVECENGTMLDADLAEAAVLIESLNGLIDELKQGWTKRRVEMVTLSAQNLEKVLYRMVHQYPAHMWVGRAIRVGCVMYIRIDIYVAHI
jgi:hypothetical protein